MAFNVFEGARRVKKVVTITVMLFAAGTLVVLPFMDYVQLEIYGIMAGILIGFPIGFHFTCVAIGYIVRGFAGIPTGEDRVPQ